MQIGVSVVAVVVKTERLALTVEWHKRFRDGRESVKDDERSGRPTTSRTDDNIAAVDKMVKEDRKVTSRLIADTLGIPKTVVLRILREDLKKRKLCSRFGGNNSTVSDSKTSLSLHHQVSIGTIPSVTY